MPSSKSPNVQCKTEKPPNMQCKTEKPSILQWKNKKAEPIFTRTITNDVNNNIPVKLKVNILEGKPELKKNPFLKSSEKNTNLPEVKQELVKNPFSKPSGTKQRKFKRITILSSSESEDETVVLKKSTRSSESNQVARKVVIDTSSSDTSDSEEKKPTTRQRKIKTEFSSVIKAENFSEEAILEQVYRYEGIYWEYDKQQSQLFNCFECPKRSIDQNVNEHFVKNHPELIAE